MKTILIVDDALMIRELLKGLLEPEGYEVFEAADGEAALTMARQRQFDLCIIDIFLPRMGGLQVMGELVKLNKHQKIIAISGGESFNPDTILELSGIFEVIETFTKPIDTGKLLRTVKKALS